MSCDIAFLSSKRIECRSLWAAYRKSGQKGTLMPTHLRGFWPGNGSNTQLHAVQAEGFPVKFITSTILSDASRLHLPSSVRLLPAFFFNQSSRCCSRGFYDRRPNREPTRGCGTAVIFCFFILFFLCVFLAFSSVFSLKFPVSPTTLKFNFVRHNLCCLLPMALALAGVFLAD